MAPALTAEPLSPKEKLTSTASPATGTRQSVRKLESSPSSGGGGSGNDTAKKPTVATIAPAAVATVTGAVETAAAAVVAPTTTSTRVTRSKDAAHRISSPVVQVPPTNKRKTNNNTHNNNNNNNSCSSSNNRVNEVKPSNDQMGLSAAATHTSTDGSAASTSGSAASSEATAATPDAAVAAEHNNNCKDNSTAELLANLTNEFEEAITAEICLRKTLPEVSLSKEQPAVVTVAEPITDPGQLVESISMSMSMAEAHSESSTSTAAATIASLPLPQPQLTAGAGAATIPVDSSSSRLLEQHEGFPGIVINSSEDRLSSVQLEDIPDSIEARLSQLDGTPVATLPPIVNVELPTTHGVSQEQLLSQQQQLLQQQQQLQSSQPDILASPQHSAIRQAAGTLLTPQSTASSINFLKDGVAGAVLEDQDIEEVLKALKNLDGTHVNPDTICDFNFFNDEVCFLNNEEEAAAAAAAASGAIAAAPVELSPKVSCSSSSNAATDKAVRPLQESHAELEQQQHVLVRKLDFMMRRLRKFQARQMCHHASDEVAGVLEWSARFSNKATPGAAPVRSAKLTEQEDTVLSIVSGRPGSSFWEEQIKQPLPATQMSNVIHQIETSARKQQICHTIGGGSASLASSSSWYSNAAQPGKRSRKTQNNNNSNNMDANSNNSSDAIVMPRADEIVPNYDSYVTSELSHVAGLLHTEMREVQNAIDSDATESSSGGESADEMVNYNNSQQLSLSIAKRAVWRYSRDRAAIALRWSWLCAQVYDLDIKIRQHNDVYNDLCRTKGDVLLESTTAPKNGYKESPISDMPDASGAASLDMDQQQSPAEGLCSRTRPLVLSEFRKRKLFQTINMHTISKKAARPSNIKCGCQWPQVPCTLCTGRPDPTAPRELPETLMPQNRVALLDASYHPVLSFSDDVCQSLHLEAISRQPDWQYRVMRGQPKAIVKSVWKSEREAIAASGGVGSAGGAGGAAGAGGSRRPGDTVKRRYVRRKERNNNSNRNSSNNNNKNMNNNNNINKETSLTTTETAAVTTPMQHSGTGADGGVGGIVGLDSGNGTGTATTSSSTSTPTTTPLVANTVAKRHRQLAKTSGNANLNSTLFDPQQQQQQQQTQKNQLNNSSLISSSGNGNGNKKSRKSASKQQQHSINNNNSQQTGSSDNNNRFPTDNHWEQSNSRRNSVETHHVHQRSERTAERRGRLIYDIDNIVIPYSMAAQTRVEILPYKEIPTPKWRIVDIDNNKKKPQQQLNTADEKLNNGCAKNTDEETESTLNPKALTAAPNETAAASTTATPTASNAATAASTATLPATTATPSAATTKPAENVSKLNGLKQSNKNNTALETAKKPEQPISNGLANGNATETEAVTTAAEEQPKQPTTKFNGKIKSNNNQISVQTASNCDGVNDSKDVVEPPKKRPKLQLKKKRPKPTKPTTAVPTAAAEPEEEPEEDISDEAYLVRHQQALIEERRRFESYLKFPWNSRPRANRRVDSRAESSGANTPDPASPAPAQLTGAIGGADNESIPSPLAQVMQQNPLDDGDVSTGGRTKGKRQERRRTTSSKLKEPDRRSATPDTREFPPLSMDPPAFEAMQFPLSKEVFQHLLAEMKIEPKPSRLTLPVMVAVSKRTKSKSVSSNGGEGNSATTASNSGSRRSSKAKSTNASKLAQTPAALRLNGSKNTTKRVAKNGGKHGYDDAMDYGTEDDDEQLHQEDEDEDDEVDELLLEEDDDYHYLAPPPEDEPLPTGVNNKSSLYNASIDAYLGEQEGLEEELADDPFMDDDPNDPEWKRSIGVRHERMRKRV